VIQFKKFEKKCFWLVSKLSFSPSSHKSPDSGVKNNLKNQKKKFCNLLQGGDSFILASERLHDGGAAWR
jgi:hypothetical protein